MIMHVLPGDAVANEFTDAGLEGQLVVCRECLVEGPVDAADLRDFWTQRRKYLASHQPDADSNYPRDVAAELEKLIALPAGSEVNLWFEYELFCQVNLWFCLYLLGNTGVTVFRVAPAVREFEEVWKGFGKLSAEELTACFSERLLLDPSDINIGREFWLAFRSSNNEKLQSLAASASEDKFPHLNAVVRAAIERDRLPAKILREITDSGISDFHQIFTAFSERAGVYGYGDSQVKALLSTL